jgi:hypothetical protein
MFRELAGISAVIRVRWQLPIDQGGSLFPIRLLTSVLRIAPSKAWGAACGDNGRVPEAPPVVSALPARAAFAPLTFAHVESGPRQGAAMPPRKTGPDVRSLGLFAIHFVVTARY